MSCKIIHSAIPALENFKSTPSVTACSQKNCYIKYLLVYCIGLNCLHL